MPFEITDATREALSVWLKLRGPRQDDWLFPSRTRAGEHMSTRHYAWLVQEWVALIDLEPKAYGTHSLRRTKVAMLYKKTGNMRACQLLLGHRKLESTVRYLGIEVDDAIAMSEQVDLSRYRPRPLRSRALSPASGHHEPPLWVGKATFEPALVSALSNKLI